MAYNTRWFFRFESVNGTEYTINIKQNGYTGTAVQRHLGQAPVLRREENEGVCGSSLELYAECQTDGEFTSLYTSDPLEYLVEVKEGSSVIWEGFVSPELYSEPDIAPPYDVQIIATDGLGELRLHEFTLTGVNSLRTILGNMLSFTGLSHTISVISSLSASAPDVVAANALLDDVSIDLGHYVGQDCYTVLQSLMSSLHSVIFLHYGEWVVARETDVQLSGSYISGYDSTGATKNFWCRSFGQMGTYSWWPVGNLTTEIVPAKNRLILTAENHYKPSILLNSEMSTDASWTKTDSSYDSTQGAYILPHQNSSIKQSLTFPAEVAYNLLLTIKARNVGDGTSSANLGVRIKMTGRTYAAGSTFYLVRKMVDRKETDSFWWMTSSVAKNYADHDLQAPSDSDTEAAATTLQVVIPLYRIDSRAFAVASAIEVEIFNSTGAYEQDIYECSLTKYEQFNGYQDVLSIDNGARESLDGIEIGFTPMLGANNISAISVMQYGVPMEDGANILTWSTSKFTSLDFLALMARDYALSHALPRARKRGTLNKPSQRIPLAFKDSDGLVYWLSSYGWNMVEEELEMEMITLPSASITVESETITEASSSEGGAFSPSSGGGGGGAVAGVSRVGLTTDISGLTISNSPIVNAGDISLSLSSGYEIPLTDRIIHNDGGTNAVKRIVVVSSYPSVEEQGVLYIKI